MSTGQRPPKHLAVAIRGIGTEGCAIEPARTVPASHHQGADGRPSSPGPSISLPVRRRSRHPRTDESGARGFKSLRAARHRFPRSERVRPDRVSLPVVLRVRVVGDYPFHGRSSTVHNDPYMRIIVATSLNTSCSFSKLPARLPLGSLAWIETVTVPPVADAKVRVTIRSGVIGCGRLHPAEAVMVRDAATNFDSQRHRQSLSTSLQLCVAGAASHSRPAAATCASTDRASRSRSSLDSRRFGLRASRQATVTSTRPYRLAVETQKSSADSLGAWSLPAPSDDAGGWGAGRCRGGRASTSGEG